MKHILKQFTQRDAHPFIQFIKYAIAGGLATMVDVVIFYFLAWKIIPSLQPDDPFFALFRDFLGLDVQAAPVEEAIRGRRFILGRGVTFLFSNLAAYFINVYWVFEPGRHERHMEVIYFYGVSIISIIIGTAIGWAMISFLGMSTTSSYLGNMIAAVMINYACRKYFVFKG